ELLAGTLDSLDGHAAWPEWSQRLLIACDQWIGDADDREALLGVLSDLGGLSAFGARAGRDEVQRVLQARLGGGRPRPRPPEAAGAVHLGAPAAIAAIPFRVLAVPGLVEGGYPGPFRLDPFLLDDEREALGVVPSGPPAARRAGQLALFDDEPAPLVPAER